MRMMLLLLLSPSAWFKVGRHLFLHLMSGNSCFKTMHLDQVR